MSRMLALTVMGLLTAGQIPTAAGSDAQTTINTVQPSVSAPNRLLLAAATDTFTIANNSIMCIGAPCPNFTITDLTSGASQNVDAVRDTAGAYISPTNDVIRQQMRVLGYFTPDSLPGWIHSGTTFVITQIMSTTGANSRPMAQRLGRTAAIDTRLCMGVNVCPTAAMAYYDMAGRRVAAGMRVLAGTTYVATAQR